MSRFGWYRPWAVDAYALPGLSTYAKAACFVLASRERGGTLRITAGQLAAQVSCSERSARRALHELESAGFIEKARKPNYLVVTLVERSAPQADQIGTKDRSRSAPQAAPTTNDRSTSASASSSLGGRE